MFGRKAWCGADGFGHSFANAIPVEELDDAPMRCIPHDATPLGVIEQVDGRIGDSLRVPDRYDEAAGAVLNHLWHTAGPTSHDGQTGVHRFQQGDWKEVAS